MLGEEGLESGDGVLAAARGDEDHRLVLAVEVDEHGDVGLPALGGGLKHLRSYLDEFVFRFNRRHTRSAAFRSLLRIAIARKPATYNMLIKPEAKA